MDPEVDRLVVKLQNGTRDQETYDLAAHVFQHKQLSYDTVDRIAQSLVMDPKLLPLFLSPSPVSRMTALLAQVSWLSLPEARYLDLVQQFQALLKEDTTKEDIERLQGLFGSICNLAPQSSRLLYGSSSFILLATIAKRLFERVHRYGLKPRNLVSARNLFLKWLSINSELSVTEAAYSTLPWELRYIPLRQLLQQISEKQWVEKAMGRVERG